MEQSFHAILPFPALLSCVNFFKSLMTWRWESFFNHAVTRITEKLDLEPYPIPIDMVKKVGSTGSRSNPIDVTTTSWGVRNAKLRQARAACVVAEPSPQVLNLVISPEPSFDLPFFGADLVTLPGGHLIALDLQPVLKRDRLHTEAVWARLLPLFDHFRPLLPDGGPIPEEAEPYFSPCFLWTRLPLTSESDTLIDGPLMDAFVAYLDLYLELVLEAVSVDDVRRQELREGQLKYLDYRAEKDPARGMLTRFYGESWTEDYIKGFLFDHR
ncbi:phycoerythrobilin:ferredoxin oxidoreductase [Cyanobium sp. ATX 6F1]|nr:phycoerythrobilin:ferredoxin oxidoreductase [Cyanobium sp. ATX 6F1]